MPGVKSSKTEYTTGSMAYEAHFPANNVACIWCDFDRAENGGSRHRCLITAELLPYYNKGLGSRCPLTFPEPAEVPEED